jgi:ABC-2 type transport system permease protein
MTAQPRHVTLWGMVRAVARLEFIDLLNYPLNAVLQQLSILVPLIISYFLARLLPGGDNSVGGDYFTFAVVGYAAFVLLQGAVSGLGKSIQTAQSLGTLETLLVEPAPWRLLPIVLGTYHVGFAALSAVVILGVGVALGAELTVAGLPAFVGVLLLGMVASLAIGTIIASLMVLAKRAAVVLAGYGMIAGLMAGSVFPVELIPAWLRWIAFVVPETYVMDAGRQLLMSDPPPALVSLPTAIVVLVAIALVASGLGTVLFSRSLQYSRRMGLLSGY